MMLNANLQRSDLLERLHAARAETDALFEIIKPEFLFDRPISERHRLAFYIGHLEAFDWNLLSERLHIAGSHADLDRLFAFGIDPVAGNLPSDQPSDWPTLEEIRAYRDLVRGQTDVALERANVDDAFEQVLTVVVEHRQMHSETLSYLFHQMPYETKSGTRRSHIASKATVTPETVRIPAGPATLGQRSSSGTFGWDNEFEGHTVDAPAFSIDKFKISNAQYLRFHDDGGYDDRDLWDDENWAWKTAHSISHPAFWLRMAGAWFWRAMFDAIPLPLDGPVYVSHAEASAYARWAGRSLPTEAQWQRAAFGASSLHPRALATRGFDPFPVNSAALGAPSEFGLVGMHANGWEWTSTVFAPFAGFRTFDFYPNYSEPFFDGMHFVLKGGSVRTAPSMLRPSFRNWFQNHYQYVYAGFRCVDIDKE
ncbi:MAG: SUMF1/EgtB/PvdO family nonheme iron enzyme [Rudaea sp.]